MQQERQSLAKQIDALTAEQNRLREKNNAQLLQINAQEKEIEQLNKKMRLSISTCTLNFSPKRIHLNKS